jgi:hypothetical protein
MRNRSANVRQHDTHSELVGRLPRPTGADYGRELDAIIVPASRPVVNLDHAVTLARAADCFLVVLCSHEARPNEVEKFLAKRSFRKGIVIDLPSGYAHPLLEFATSETGNLPAACGKYVTDLSSKRNIGLLLARMVGWERIFYLDDDIRDISDSALAVTVSMLGKFHSAGMQVLEFPDNSIVCHAHRETGEFQDVFVSGSALAVHGAKATGFFPNVYNEDWLFFYPDAALGKLGASGLPATQLVYDPFKEPARAAWQEFGDVLAEGLYGLLHQGKGTEHATSEYWAEFLRERRNFLLAIIDRADRAKPEMQDSIRTAVREALECSAAIKAGEYERYVQLWQEDLRDWKRRIVGLPSGLSVEKALNELNLPASTDGLGTGTSSRIQPGPAPFPHIPTHKGSRTAAAPVHARPEPVAAQADDTLPMLAIDIGPYVPDCRRQVVTRTEPLRSRRAQWRRTFRPTAGSLVRPATPGAPTRRPSQASDIQAEDSRTSTRRPQR